MATALIGMLLVLCCFLGMRLFSASSEISALRANVTSLKRRLEQQR